jgi:tRNA-2-methylthio-N6-dimethylallyladenosine synthase
VSLTTDLIVGFPGETEEHFERSLETYRWIRFDQAFTFAYSPREGTAAARLDGQLSRAEKQSRLARLIALQNEISTAVNQEWVGRTAEVMVEGPSESNPERLMGRGRNNKVVIMPGADLAPGALVTVRLTRGRLWGWEGETA